MIARLSVYAPSRSDWELLIQGVRWYFWLVWTVQEAKLRRNKLRTLLCGRGPKPPTPSAPEAAWRSTPSLLARARRPSPRHGAPRRGSLRGG
jgi:hypothetical protein